MPRSWALHTSVHFPESRVGCDGLGGRRSESGRTDVNRGLFGTTLREISKSSCRGIDVVQLIGPTALSDSREGDIQGISGRRPMEMHLPYKLRFSRCGDAIVLDARAQHVARGTVMPALTELAADSPGACERVGRLAGGSRRRMSVPHSHTGPDIVDVASGVESHPCKDLSL